MHPKLSTVVALLERKTKGPGFGATSDSRATGLMWIATSHERIER
jgi:hypothetical protein